MKNFVYILFFTVIMVACKKESDKETEEPQDIKGKIAPSLSKMRDGDIEFYDIRDLSNPKKAAFKIKGDVNMLTLNFVKNRTIGAGTVKDDYGDLSINYNNEMYLADKNWANWSNISMVRNGVVMNNGNVNQLYPASQDEEGKTTLYDYASTFNVYAGQTNWGKAGTINGCVEIYESYSTVNRTRNAFYFNFKTQEYIFQRDINNLASNPAINGYKFTDLIRKPNGNMDTDPIDWTKTDFAFALGYDTDYKPFVYNGKQVSVLIFVDLDTKTYIKVVRNLEDDPVNGADKGRQTLLTTSWRPLHELIKGWNL